MDPKKLELFRQKAIQSGYSQSAVDSFISNQQKQAATLNLTKQGVVNVGDLAKTDPILAQKAISQGVRPQAKLSADEEKRAKAKENADRIVTQLENLYFKGGQTEGLAAGRAGGLISSAKQATGKFEQLNTYQKARESSRPTLARAFGDVGNLSQPEQEAAVGLLPTQYSTPEEAFAGFQAIREKLGLGISERLGEIKQKASQSQTSIPQTNQQGFNIPGLSNILGMVSAGSGGVGIGPGAGAVDISGPLTDILFSRTKPVVKKALEGQMPTGGELVGAGAETALNAATLFPPTAPFAAASRLGLLGKLGLGVAKTALPGAIYGATDPNAKSLEERGQKALTGGIGSLGISGLLKLPGATAKGFIGKAEKRISELFKPTPSQLSEFERKTGLKFSKEVIKRDLDNIAGKSGPEILEYYTSKLSRLDDAADKFLADTGKVVNKKKIIDIVDKELAKLTPVKGRILQSGGRAILQELRDELAQLPNKIKLDVVNQMKRDAQTRGQAALGPSGSSSPGANALASIQGNINKLLQDEAPGIKEVNKSIQFYRFAKDNIEKQVNQAEKSGGGILNRLLGSGAVAGGVGSIATGNPLLAGATISPYLYNLLQSSPQFKTKAAQLAPNLEKQVVPDFLRKLIELQGGRAGASL